MSADRPPVDPVPESDPGLPAPGPELATAEPELLASDSELPAAEPQLRAPAPVPTAASRARIAALTVARILIAVAVVFILRLGGGAQAADDSLQVMGFDPDRATLIVALILAALAATTVSLSGGGRPSASLTGLGVATLWFARTFVDETERALQPSGPTTRFDAVGWLLTLLALTAAALAAGWAAAILAREARHAILAAYAAIDPRGHVHAGPAPLEPRGVAARPLARGWRRAGPVVRVVLVTVIAAATLPVLGDVLNFDPDVHMQVGGTTRIGLTGAGAGAASPGSAGSGGPSATTGPGGASGPGASTRPAAIPPDLVAGPIEGSFVTAGALGAASWAPVPSGSGRTLSVQLPGPWTGGRSATATIDIYLPPGYDAGAARYPVFYEAPSGIAGWDRAMAFISTMDALITSGQLPPVILVFAMQDGGPYTDSECADSYDGHEWFNRFMATDVVGWVDAHLRTIATPQARATLGFSQGGYCSAAMMARHPDVFRTSVSMSGYYQAGVRSGTTPTAWRPFNDDPAAMAAASPLVLVPALPPSVRSGLMVILEADPDNAFYGAQMAMYVSALDAAHVAMAVLPDSRGHSWDAARPDIPAMMRIAAMRMAKLGVFDTTP
jgi:hypothetical protein